MLAMTENTVCPGALLRRQPATGASERFAQRRIPTRHVIQGHPHSVLHEARDRRGLASFDEPAHSVERCDRQGDGHFPSVCHTDYHTTERDSQVSVLC